MDGRGFHWSDSLLQLTVPEPPTTMRQNISFSTLTDVLNSPYTLHNLSRLIQIEALLINQQTRQAQPLVEMRGQRMRAPNRWIFFSLDAEILLRFCTGNMSISYYHLILTSFRNNNAHHKTILDTAPWITYIITYRELIISCRPGWQVMLPIPPESSSLICGWTTLPLRCCNKMINAPLQYFSTV